MPDRLPGEGQRPVSSCVATGPRPSPGKPKVAVLISGRGSNMQALVRGAEASQAYGVSLIASDKREAPGLTWADEHGLMTYSPMAPRVSKADWEAMLDEALVATGIEVIALAGYMRLLSPTFVARWAGRILNIHPSLLPAYKGLDTHARAIAAGEREAGCSVHLVTEELDAGAVLGQARVPVLPDDTPEALAARVLVEEHRLYPKVLAEFCTQ